MLRVTAAVPITLCCVVFAWCMPRPPQTSRTVALNGQRYYSGSVYISAYEDTVDLRALGFRNLEFVERSGSSLMFSALWPDTVAATPMPGYMNGIVYETVPAEPEDSTDDLHAVRGRPRMERRSDPDFGFPDRKSSHSRNRIDYEGLKRLSTEGDAPDHPPVSIIMMPLGMRATFKHYPLPRDGTADTLIDGIPYVFGDVSCLSYEDTLTLHRDFGFRCFSTKPQGMSGIAIGAATVRLWIFNAAWPMMVETDKLPHTVASIKVRRCIGAVAVPSKGSL